MKLQFIGVGSAFTKRYYQSNMLLSHDDEKLLLDCGTTAHQALADLGLDIKDLIGCYISHPHADHIGGLEEYALCSYFNPVKHDIWPGGKPKMFIDEASSYELWDNSLKGGLRTLEGQVPTLDTYFDIVRVPKNSTFEAIGHTFHTVQVYHVMDKYHPMPAFGLIWETDNNRVFCTTDAQHCPNQMIRLYKDATIIFQDCETTPWKSGVHAHYDELKELDADIKAKMWLYHYWDGDLPDAEADGFAGFIKQGQVFEL